MANWLGLPVVEKYKDLYLRDLPLNHAYVIANTTIDVIIDSVKDGCFNCPFNLVKHLKANVESYWTVDAGVQESWRVRRVGDGHERDLLCLARPTVHEYGVYRFEVGKCVVTTEVAPVNTYLPLLVSIILLLSCCMIYTLSKFLWNRKNKANEEEGEKFKASSGKVHDGESQSLHVFRGILLPLLIFSTTGGGGYPIFDYVWGGLSFADVVFYAFAWSIGLNIPTVINTAFGQLSKCCIIRDIVVRALILITLGTMIDFTVGYKQVNHVTLWCPLQRIGVAYLIVSSAYVLTVQRFEMKSKNIFCKAISNVVALLWCWIISGFILAVFIIMISAFISFNCMANVSPNQRSSHLEVIVEATQNCNNDLTMSVNKLFVAEFKGMVDANSFYGFGGGIMGMMTTVIYTMIGLKAGVIHGQPQSHSDRIHLWTLWATLFGVCGIAFAIVSRLIVLNLWPISSILLISTLSMFIFTIIYTLTDVWRVTSYILASIGVTSLTILVGHLLFSKTLPFTWPIVFTTHIMYLLQSYWISLLWVLIGVVVVKRRVTFEI